MTPLKAAIVLVFALAYTSPPLPGDAQSGQSTDPLCPRAVPSIQALNDAAAKGADAAAIALAARKVADAYLACWSDAKVNAYAEPTANYNETRVAQYLVVAGRASAAAGKTAEATRAFKDARAYADEVATWIPAAQTVHQSAGLGGNSSARNSDRQPSRYREAALAVRDEAAAALAKLAPDAGSPSPAARPAAPAASPRP